MLFNGTIGFKSFGTVSNAPPPAYLTTLPSMGSGGNSGASGNGMPPLLAFDMSLLTGSNGSAITSIPDQCGTGKILIPNSGNHPTLSIGGMNGKNAVYCTAQNQGVGASGLASVLNGLENKSFTLLQTLEIENYGVSGAQTFSVGDAAYTNILYGLDSASGNTFNATRNVAAGGSNTVAVTGSGLINTTYVKVLRFNQATSILTYNVNNQSASVPSGGTIPNPWDNIGINYVVLSSDNNGVIGKYGEFVIWPVLATDAQVTALLTQQHAKWG